MDRDSFKASVYPRKHPTHQLEREIDKMAYTDKQVLLSFTSDPYNRAEAQEGMTREFLSLALGKLPVAILTKGGAACMKDLALFKLYKDHIQVGATLTFSNNTDSLFYEPEAALPLDRLETLAHLHQEGIKTWASFEPVIDPVQSLELIKMTLPYIDTYKIGKVNNYNGRDEIINWKAFLERSLVILRPAQKQVYIKYDLRQSAPDVVLASTEVDLDMYIAPAWKQGEYVLKDSVNDLFMSKEGSNTPDSTLF
jgi:DNA repair photolyase